MMNAIIPIEDCSPIAFENVFEEGDRWKKITGCEQCPTEKSRHCCGNCRMKLDNACIVHLQGNGRQKPLQCVIDPPPNVTWSWCCQQYECVKGSRKGTIRKICEPIPWLL
jgi:hypothetical protein